MVRCCNAIDLLGLIQSSYQNASLNWSLMSFWWFFSCIKQIFQISYSKVLNNWKYCISKGSCGEPCWNSGMWCTILIKYRVENIHSRPGSNFQTKKGNIMRRSWRGGNSNKLSARYLQTLKEISCSLLTLAECQKHRIVKYYHNRRLSDHCKRQNQKSECCMEKKSNATNLFTNLKIEW